MHPALLQLAPDAATRLDAARELAVAALDDATVARCRAQLAATLAGGPAPGTAGLDPLARAQLAFVEQFAFSVGDVTDTQVAVLREHLDDTALWAFVAAVYELDMALRLALVAEAVLA